MERNWLIRTSQNQILGPVAKQKLLEFIQKGALGLTDEVTSGNGFWFYLKEKDLVDKYLYGDIPQGYNPISESKSVLAKRENPEKTTSINTAPVNKASVSKDVLEVGLVPKPEDLEFPDITIVTKAAVKLPVNESDAKLPNSDDLEFPDITLVTKNVSLSPPVPQSENKNLSMPPVLKEVKKAQKIEIAASVNEQPLYPQDDDLAFPDFDDHKTSTKVGKGQVDLSHQYTRTVALDQQQIAIAVPEAIADDEAIHFSLTLDVPSSSPEIRKEEAVEGPVEAKPLLLKKERREHSGEERKLLHDRKPKVAPKAAAMRDPKREVVHREIEDQSSHLKKRNDNYLFFILIILILIILAVFFYFKEILNKPLPV